MASPTVEVVRQLVQAFNERNRAAIGRLLGPEVVWEPGGPAAVERALYRGRDEVCDGFEATWETWEVFHLEEDEVRDLGESAVWLGHTRMKGDASHVEFEQAFAVHFIVRDGMVLRFRGFLGWQEALEAAGLSE